MDRQLFYSYTEIAANRKPNGRAQYGHLSVPTAGSSKSSQQSTHNTSRGVGPSFRADAIEIPSDSESDDEDDFFPPIEELIGRDRGSVAGAGKDSNTSSGAGDNAVGASVIHGLGQDNGAGNSAAGGDGLRPDACKSSEALIGPTLPPGPIRDVLVQTPDELPEAYSVLELNDGAPPGPPTLPSPFPASAEHLATHAGEHTAPPCTEPRHDAFGMNFLKPPSLPALLERRLTSAGPSHLVQDPPSPVGSDHAPRSSSVWSTPEAATCDEGARFSGASPARGAGTPSSGHLSRHCSPGLEDHSDREGMPCRRPVGDCQKASDNDINDKAGTLIAKRNLRPRKADVRDGDHYASGISSVNSDDESGDGQPFDTRGNLQSNPGSRRRDHGDDGTYHPRNSDSDQLSPRKRRRRSSPASTPRRTAAKRQTGSHRGDSRRRQIQKRSPLRHDIPSPPFSQGPGKEIETETTETQFAEFKQWPLEDVVLKSATVNGETKYQLEFSRGRCPDHECNSASPRHQQRRLPAKRHRLAGQSPASTAGAPTPPNENEWEVEEILASRTHYKKLQYQAKWVDWETDQTWYYAEGFKGCPHLLKQYHQDYPEMPGPPVRLEQWLRAHEDGVNVEHHPEDNKPVAGATRAKEP
ncbi:hypothetical protein GGTG_13853 [Gaeumannomyces tritici R3-111a-1]|uniref:Chromo domain-containing protein n=1 Tax=Gaeumannomyces tritici (strain R3-111a-1) TaxID=644352 RepID=J3PK08_GAET3|nr:hypothetical protein GGTG_13853 [Gaeumannomyces tritici R3-111a-1]EJT68567.1 hypothetical protein GGTG_13853 [Gaeumannomyces tritici R3-111a-1]